MFKCLLHLLKHTALQRVMYLLTADTHTHTDQRLVPGPGHGPLAVACRLSPMIPD